MRICTVRPAEDADLARSLLSVQHAAYAVEAELIQDDRIPALHETIDDLRQTALSWVAAFDAASVIGAIAWSESPIELDIDRLVVAPSRHRHGVGTALVQDVAARAGRRRMVVSTGRANFPARALYEGLDFVHVGDDEVITGLWVSGFARLP